MKFCEAIGKFCFLKLPPFLFYLMICLPIALSLGYFSLQYSRFQELEEAFYTSSEKGKKALQKKQKKDEFLSRYSNPNPYFLNEQIESLFFLEKEKNTIQTLLAHPALIEKKPLETRLLYLTKNNQLQFIQERVHTSSWIKETEEKQKYPVEMDEKDLHRVLALIEDTDLQSKHRPYFLLTQMSFRKKQTPIKTDVLEVEMKILKREFVQKKAP